MAREPDADGPRARACIAAPAIGSCGVARPGLAPSCARPSSRPRTSASTATTASTWSGSLRALPYDLVHLSFAQGASTITEQVAKLLYLGGNDHSPWRKLEDAALALKLESRYTKEQILAAYLNSAYFGEGANGVRAASERYFGVAPDRLDHRAGDPARGADAGAVGVRPVRAPRARPRAPGRRCCARSSAPAASPSTEASRALGRPLRLRERRALAPVRGVDLSPGPAFVWWQLALGAAFALAGAAALVVLRRLRFGGVAGLWAARAISAGALAVGAAIVVRSFRSV